MQQASRHDEHLPGIFDIEARNFSALAMASALSVANSSIRPIFGCKTIEINISVTHTFEY
jgi:hypothetical protein